MSENDQQAADGGQDAPAARAEAGAGDAATFPTGGCDGLTPIDGQPCAPSGLTCVTKAFGCGGAIVAACDRGVWTVTQPACPSETCPDNPAPGGACKVNGQGCRYWSFFSDAGTACTDYLCESGQWVSVHTACNAAPTTCSEGLACTAPSGCVLGKCAPNCLCGVDGVLHCTAHPC